MGIGIVAQGNTGWITIDNQQLIDSTNTQNFMEFENTPESVVNYFYASKIRNDSLWKNVLPLEKEQSLRLKSKLVKYSQWKFHKMKILQKKAFAENAFWIKIFMEIEYKGQKKSGKDELDVQLINGKWTITSVPT
ncbi:MAG: hypothetical protein B6I20_12710 [Bacteroidetes bacterium 4572_117]|nr:MAG: hypothetical protein B6I20_12710 [Bacteroidetes bacterium 4572_117]